MRAKGIIKLLDNQGRLLIPSDFLASLEINRNSKVELIIVGNDKENFILIRKPKK